MIETFKNKMKRYGTDNKYLLAVSGGIDSMVLARLCQLSGLNFELAHCNFKLRGAESDADADFVKTFAETNQIPLHFKICDLQNATENNTQIAARNARYQWFAQLKSEYGFDYILTAHHRNDAIETFLINMQRGTGIQGLTGIQESDEILRPLLNFTRKEIKDFAIKNKIQWREDSSNASDKYLRNFIRHQIVPKFKKINPAFETTMQKTISHLQEDVQIVQDWVQSKIKEWTKQKNDEIWIDLSKIQHPKSFLFHLLAPYGFTDWKAVMQLTKAQAGKEIKTAKYRLIKYEHFLILSQLENVLTKTYIIQKLDDFANPALPVTAQLLEAGEVDLAQVKNAEKHIAYVDFDKIQFPVTLRNWQAGDYFYPMGMSGKKKISDFYKDEKIPKTQREKIWLFLSRKNIFWIGGFRPDKRYIITTHTRRVLKLSIKQQETQSFS